MRSMGFAERMFDAMVWFTLGTICIIIIIPLVYVVSISVTPFEVWAENGMQLFINPSDVTFDAYERLMSSPRLPRAFLVTFYITAMGTFINLVMTTVMAYPLSKQRFLIRNPITLLVLFTMMFGGGLIPTYLIVRDLGMINTFWALMIPNAISQFNLLVMIAFFRTLPQELEDAARIDGGGDLLVFFRIALPLSKPALATIGLFYAVGHWNAFFNALIYIQDADKQPLQIVLRQILQSVRGTEFIEATAASAASSGSVQMAAVILASIPILLVYPFLQRYFTKGVLLGSVKG